MSGNFLKKLISNLAFLVCIIGICSLDKAEGSVTSYIQEEECLWILGHEHKTCRAEGMRCGCKTFCCKGSVCKGGPFWKTCHRREDEARVGSYTGSRDSAGDVMELVKELCEATFSGKHDYRHHFSDGMYSHLTVLCGDEDLDKLYEKFHGVHNSGLSDDLKDAATGSSSSIHNYGNNNNNMISLLSISLFTYIFTSLL